MNAAPDVLPSSPDAGEAGDDEQIGSADEAKRRILMSLKQHAEDEVKQVKAELAEVRKQVQLAVEGNWESVNSRQWKHLRQIEKRLEHELSRAKRRLDAELDGLRRFAGLDPLKEPADTRSSELFEAALRILPEYSGKLDRLVQAAMTIWEQRLNKTKTLPEDVLKSLDPPVRIALVRLSEELARLSHPLEEWIHKFSAAHEEGRLTDLQRMELRLRLVDLESKYKTALDVFAKLTPQSSK